MHELEASALLHLRHEAGELGVGVSACLSHPLEITLLLDEARVFWADGPAAGRRCMDWLAGYRKGKEER